MKQVLILADCFLPEKRSASYLISDLTDSFVAQGNSVVLVVADQNLNKQNTIERLHNVTIIRVRSHGIKKSSFLTRGFKEAILPHLMVKAMKAHVTKLFPSLIVVYSPSIFLTPAALWVKKKFKTPIYLVLRDIFPDWAIEAGVIKSKWVRIILRHVAQRQYDSADRIGVQSLRDLETFSNGRYTIYRDKTEHLPNWRAPWIPPVPSTTLKESLGLSNRVVFFVGGSIGPAQNPENLFKIARAMLTDFQPTSSTKAHFLLIGSGPYFALAQERIKNENLTNMSILPEMDFAQYSAHLAIADVGVLLLDSRISSDNIPGRFLDYLQMALPVFAMINPGNELLTYLSREKLGIGVDANDLKLAIKCVQTLTVDGELRSRLGKDGPELLARDFSPESAVAKIRLLDKAS